MGMLRRKCSCRAGIARVSSCCACTCVGCAAAQMGVHAHMGMSISAHPCEIFLTSSSTRSLAPPSPLVFFIAR